MKKYVIKSQQECFLIQDDIQSLKRQIHLLRPSQIIMVSDRKVQGHAIRLQRLLQIKKCIILNISESSKSIQVWNRLQKIFFRLNVDRRTVVLAVGGGVVGDLLGLVCHTYMRGVPWVSVPTTLLSQLDSGVGGKNALNTDYSKNIIGTVYQPRICYLLTDFLKTLPQREIVSGMGEALKYSFLNQRIKVNRKDFESRNYKVISNVIRQCLEYKLKLVCKDPQDTHGFRQQLNLGHTFAHALEAATGYKKFRHGEAVIYGLRFALIVSRNKGLLRESLCEAYFVHLKDIVMPQIPRSLSGELLYKLAQKDKKSVSGEIKMVLLEKKGKVRNPVSVTREEFLRAYEQLKIQD